MLISIRRELINILKLGQFLYEFDWSLRWKLNFR